jgi:hypothetical protein
MTHTEWNLEVQHLDNKEISKLIDFLERIDPRSFNEYITKRSLISKIYYSTSKLEDFTFVDAE